MGNAAAAFFSLVVVFLFFRSHRAFVVRVRSPLNLSQNIPSGGWFAFWCIYCSNVFGSNVNLWVKDQSGGGTPAVQVRKTACGAAVALRCTRIAATFVRITAGRAAGGNVTSRLTA